MLVAGRTANRIATPSSQTGFFLIRALWPHDAQLDERRRAALLGAREGITKLRGNWHKWRDIPVMPTYHPSYLLRSPSQKRVAWDDLKLARRTYEAGR